MQIKVFLTLNIDEDEYPVPVDGQIKEEVNEIWQKVSTKLYEQTSDNETATENDSTAEDVEYEEVK